MQVVVPTESWFARSEDGVIRPVKNPFLGYHFWTRYLDVFSEVYITGRINKEVVPPQNYAPVTGERVHFIGLPEWHNVWQHLRKRSLVAHLLQEAVSGKAVCLRAPTEVATLLSAYLVARSHPFGVEVVGDPWDALGPGNIRTPLRPLLRLKSYFDLKKICQEAVASAYVTEKTLQRRYPPAVQTFTTHFSSIELRDDDFASSVKRTYKPPIRLCHVGSMASALYKGQDVLLEVFALLKQQWVEPITLTLVGDGKRRKELENLAGKLGISSQVRFTGLLPGPEAVRMELDRADLFVFPSRTEGLPKALVEAMARGLPAIGTHVGGIPELLPSECLVEPNNVDSLASKIIWYLKRPEEMRSVAARNLERAKDYHIDVIRQRRIAYYREVKKTTESWMRRTYE